MARRESEMFASSLGVAFGNMESTIEPVSKPIVIKSRPTARSPRTEKMIVSTTVF
jgi:hypothetical protein